mgnify:FL=1
MNFALTLKMFLLHFRTLRLQNVITLLRMELKFSDLLMRLDSVRDAKMFFHSVTSAQCKAILLSVMNARKSLKTERLFTPHTN